LSITGIDTQGSVDKTSKSGNLLHYQLQPQKFIQNVQDFQFPTNKRANNITEFSFKIMYLN